MNARTFDVDAEGSVPELETIEVAHVARSKGTIDCYGGRKRRDGVIRHAGNTSPPEPGWLGNPFEMDEETVAERRRVIAAYLRFFLDKVSRDEDFRAAVERLRGQRCGCWCRGVTQDRTPETWCHLDVVKSWLAGDLTPVYDYLRGGNDE